MNLNKLTLASLVALSWCLSTALAQTPPITGKIAFVKNGDLFMRTYVTGVQQGSEQRLTFTGAVLNPRLSRDGTKLAFSFGGKNPGPGVYVMDAAPESSTNPRKRLSTFASYWPAWSFDGQWIAFNGADPKTSGIFTVKADGMTNPTRRTAHGWYPAWSPDPLASTSQILFASDRNCGHGNSDLWIMSAFGALDANAGRLFASSPCSPGSEMDLDWQPFEMLYSYDASDGNGQDVYVYDGTTITHLNTGPGGDVEARWASCNGTLIVFRKTLPPSAGFTRVIYVRDLLTGTQSQLITGDVYQPTWGPLTPCA